MNKKRKLFLQLFTALVAFCSSVSLSAQNSIVGPTCANPGLPYVYTLSAYYSGTANFNYYITAGTLSTGGSSGVHAGPGVTQITVTWTHSGSIMVISPAGSTSLSVTVVPVLTGGTISSGKTQNIAYNAVPVAINCSASAGGPCSGASYAYQWLQSPDNVSFSNVNGATSQNLSFGTGQKATTYYKRKVTETTTNTVTYSDVASVILTPPNPILTVTGGSITPATQNIYYNNNSGELTSTGVTNGTYAYTYQWQSSPDNATWANVPSTTTVYTAPSLTGTAYFRVGVKSNGVTAYSSSAIVNVYPQLFPGSVFPENITIASGGNPGSIVATKPTGSDGNYSYQWQSSTNGTSFSNIAGATTLSYSPGTLATGMWYQLMITAGATVYTNVCAVAISSSAPDLNFVRARDIKKAAVTDSAAALALTNTYEVAQTTQYYDGLGRTLQTVAMQQSPLQKDILSFSVYDGFGREPVKYLPYTASTTDGNFKPTGQADEYTFNATLFPTEQYYFTQTVFEPSPLNRPIATYAPGSSWVGSLRGTTLQYNINTMADSVRVWTIAMTPNSIPVTSSIYAGATLFENIITDEAGHQAVEYKDLEGKVILKKVQLAASPGTAHVGWLCTYYVYDVMNHLRFVIQPQAVIAINSTWTLTGAIANELCFRYEYDERGRMYIKKIPGAGEVKMVYDARDRMVLSQDSLMFGQQKWLFTKYDSQNRVDSVGTITDPANYNNLTYHKNAAANSIVYPVVSSYTNELLTKNYYDNYSWAAGAGLPATMATSYTSNSSYFVTTYNATPAYAVNPVPSYITRGMATGSKRKVLGSASQYLYSVNFYDDRGRMIQSQGTNITGAVDTLTTQFDFSGRPIRNLQQHSKSGTNAQTHKVLTKLSYDAGGRLLTVYKNIDAGTDQLITTNTYNELGQLNTKAEGNSIETLNYAYNIRGWLTSINKGYLTNSSTNYFGFELGYDKTTAAVASTSYAAAQYNGNITGTIWKSKGDGINRKYDFTYDNVNRLTGANFNQNSSGTTWSPTLVDFTVSNLTYDANGNILSMNQKGFKVNGSSLVDQLTYNYITNSNKLAKVGDAASDPATKLGDFHDGTNGATDDYSYDGNGNLTLDNNKAISSITYNHLNLPNTITVTSKGTIVYTYDADGNKLQKKTTEGSQITTTLYIGNFVYQNDTLQFIGHEEGRTRWAFHKYLNGNTQYKFEYDYFLKDHLGNTRMVLTQQKDTAQYMATMEAAYRNTEKQLFYNIPASNYSRAAVAGYPTDATTNPNDSLMKLNGSGQKTGASIILKVMSGDEIDIAVKSFYKSGGTANTPSSSLTDVLSSFANGIVATAAGSKGALGDLNNTSTSPLFSAINSFNTANTSTPAGKPKAYLNWIMLDDQLQYVSTYPQSGAVQAGTADVINTLGYTNIPVTKNGYLYIYVTNETPGWDAFFDNLSIQHRSGPVLEETHYYPFGLAMSGISSKALKSGYAENKKKYNGIEFDNDLDLNTYEAFYRNLDPQTGRWWQIDPKVDAGYEDVSPYASMYDDPEKFNDPLGDEACCSFIAAYADIKTTQKIAGTVILTGGGPEDPVADVVAGVVEVGGAIKAGYDFFTKSDADLLPRLKTPTAPIAPAIDPATVKGTMTLYMPKDAKKPDAQAKATDNTNSKTSSLPKPGKGKGTVPPGQRDKKRAYTKEEKQEILDNQNGKCTECGEQKTVDEVHGHHVKRHADGGRTTEDNGAAVCKDCHTKLHQ